VSHRQAAVRLPSLGLVADGRWPLAIALALLASFAYANALQNGFVLDDRGIVLEHPLVRDPSMAWRAFLSPYWPEAIGGGQYRPLGILSFALDRAIAGPSAVWYHAVNLLWHAAATVLLWYWARRLLAPIGAIAAAALFAVHPVHVEAVANVVGRLELMAATFVFAALIAHDRGSRLAPMAYAAALLSKEHAVVFLALALLAHWREPGAVAAVHARRSLWAAHAGVTVVWLVVMLAVARDAPSVTSAVFHDLTAWQRWLTVLTIVPEYVRLLVFPLQLSADYEPAVIQPARQIGAAVLLGVVVLGLVIWLAWRAWRGHRAVSIALLWVPIALAPVANVFFATGVALAERTLYLPSAGACLLGGWALQRAGASRAMFGTALFGLLLASAQWRTWTRTPVWRDSRSFAITLLEDHPESYRGHWVAARVLLSAGDADGARREFEIARQLFAADSTLNREALKLDSALALRRGPGDASTMARPPHDGGTR
jgi:hypothetical protein